MFMAKIDSWIQNIAEVLLLENQNGFGRGHSCGDDIFGVDLVIEKSECSKNSALAESEKTFGCAVRDNVWKYWPWADIRITYHWT
jgi:hypothetical protein